MTSTNTASASPLKPWWRPFAQAVVDSCRAGRTGLPDLADALLTLPLDLDLGLPREVIHAGLRACASPRGAIRTRLPDRARGGFARVLWRNLRFQFGGDLGLGSMMMAQVEASRIENDVAEDIATILATLARAKGGPDAWASALGIR